MCRTVVHLIFFSIAMTATATTPPVQTNVNATQLVQTAIDSLPANLKPVVSQFLSQNPTIMSGLAQFVQDNSAMLSTVVQMVSQTLVPMLSKLDPTIISGLTQFVQDVSAVQSDLAELVQKHPQMVPNFATLVWNDLAMLSNIKDLGRNNQWVAKVLEVVQQDPVLTTMLTDITNFLQQDVPKVLRAVQQDPVIQAVLSNLTQLVKNNQLTPKLSQAVPKIVQQLTTNRTLFSQLSTNPALVFQLVNLTQTDILQGSMMLKALMENAQKLSAVNVSNFQSLMPNVTQLVQRMPLVFGSVKTALEKFVQNNPSMVPNLGKVIEVLPAIVSHLSLLVQKDPTMLANLSLSQVVSKDLSILMGGSGGPTVSRVDFVRDGNDNSRVKATILFDSEVTGGVGAFSLVGLTTGKTVATANVADSKKVTINGDSVSVNFMDTPLPRSASYVLRHGAGVVIGLSGPVAAMTTNTHKVKIEAVKEDMSSTATSFLGFVSLVLMLSLHL